MAATKCSEEGDWGKEVVWAKRFLHKGPKYFARKDRDRLWDVVNMACARVDADSHDMKILEEIALLLQRPVQQLRYVRVEWRKQLFNVLQSVEEKKVVRAPPLTKPPKTKPSTTWVTVDENPDSRDESDVRALKSALEMLDLKKSSYIVRPNAFGDNKATIFVDEKDLDEIKKEIESKGIRCGIISSPTLESLNESGALEEGSTGLFLNDGDDHFMLTAGHVCKEEQFFRRFNGNLDLGMVDADNGHHSLFSGTLCRDFEVRTRSGQTSLVLKFPHHYLGGEPLEFVIERGKRVFKIGHKTGLTVGKFFGVAKRIRMSDLHLAESGRPEDRIYEDMVLVESDGPSDFTDHGDSGSAYYVRCVNEAYKFSAFVPIAIHQCRAKLTKTIGGTDGEIPVSMGLLLPKALEWVIQHDKQIDLCDESCLENYCFDDDEDQFPEIVEIERMHKSDKSDNW